jgi:regulator of sirC expression with transglutaminase-like and TPR domain
MEDGDNPLVYLRQMGRTGEGPHDIARAALMLASLDHPTVPLGPSFAHLDEVAQLAKNEASLMSNVEEGARLLSNLLSGRFGYDGDRLTYDDPRNANLIQVIARRRGMPVALGIIYMHAARAAGLTVCGLDTPAHFLLMLAKNNAEMLIDPFNGGVALDPDRISAPPRMGGAEGVHLAQPVSDTDVLIRLENNLKVRALQIGDRARAREIAKRMVLVGPGKAELWLDLARLNEGAGLLREAREAYESCLDIARPGQSLHNEAALGLTGLKRLIN